MNTAWKACLVAGAILLCGFIVWIDLAARLERRTKQEEENRRVAIEKNRALIATQAAAVKDGPGKTLTGTESAKSSPAWKKPSAAFLATEARFANPQETPPPPAEDVINYSSAPEKKR